MRSHVRRENWFKTIPGYVIDSNLRGPDRRFGMSEKMTLASLLEMFADGLGHAFHLARYYLEHVFVLIVEGINRAVQRLDPRLYFEALRVRSVIDGSNHKATKKFAIFLLYSSGPLPRFTLNLIESFKRSPFNLVIVSNKQLDESSSAHLLSRCSLLVERANVGRDFGGYKDGISVVLSRFPEVERLVIANDSVFFLEDGLDHIVAGLDGADAFIGVSEVHDHHYHIASFMMSFGRGVIQSPAFRRFWQRYLPISTRRWAIFKGEGDLTATLVEAGFRPHVLFQAEHLREHLTVRPPLEFSDLVELLPIGVRNEMSARFDKLAERLQRGPAGIRTMGNEIASIVIGAIMARNQMHAGGFLFHKYLGLPVIKRDIVYREICSLQEIPRILNTLDPIDLNEIMTDLRRREPASRLGPLRKVFYRHSAA